MDGSVTQITLILATKQSTSNKRYYLVHVYKSVKSRESTSIPVLALGPLGVSPTTYVYIIYWCQPVIVILYYTFKGTYLSSTCMLYYTYIYLNLPSQELRLLNLNQAKGGNTS